jgi:hypothetical protein
VVAPVCLQAFVEVQVAILGESAAVLMRVAAAGLASTLDELVGQVAIEQAAMRAAPAAWVAFPDEIAPDVSSAVRGLACRSQDALRPQPVESNLQDALHWQVSLHWPDGSHSPVVHCSQDGYCLPDVLHSPVARHCWDAFQSRAAHRLPDAPPPDENPAGVAPALSALRSQDAYRRPGRAFHDSS